MVSRRLSLSVLAVLCGAVPAWGGQIVLPPQLGGAYTVATTSYTESRFQRVVRQQYDFSCGAAAVATLLTYHYGRSISEQAVFAAMYERGDQERIRRDGFSMLDMKHYLAAEGIQADGFRIGLDQLRQLGLPAIALTNISGFLHFVVIKGVTWDEVLIGDPALGMRRLPRDQFEASWNGLLFLIRDDVEVGQRHFNLAAEWGALSRAPLAEGVNRAGTPNFMLSVTAGGKL